MHPTTITVLLGTRNKSIQFKYCFLDMTCICAIKLTPSKFSKQNTIGLNTTPIIWLEG